MGTYTYKMESILMTLTQVICGTWSFKFVSTIYSINYLLNNNIYFNLIYKYRYIEGNHQNK